MRVDDVLRRLDRSVLPRLSTGMRRLSQPRPRRVMLVMAAAGVLTTVLVVAPWSKSDPPAPVQEAAGDVVRVGVGQGQSIAGYVGSTQRELRGMVAAPPTPPLYGLVTFDAYLAADRLGAALDGVGLVAVYVRVPLPRTQTEIIRLEATHLPEDVHAGMALVADRKDREAAEYRALALKLTGRGAQERALRSRYVGGALVAEAEAEAYRSDCSCVYAAVVRGRVPQLRRLLDRPGVRAVDAAPEVQRLDRAVFLPPLPEQRGVTARPPDDHGSARTIAESRVDLVGNRPVAGT